MNEPRIELRHALVNGVSIHHAVCGQAGRPLVIFLHGFPQAWFAWERQLLDLGRGYLAVAPDLRGINLSGKPANVRDYRAHLVAADVVALAQSLGYEQFSLVGHDWGGAIAYTLAIGHAQRVTRLVVMNAVHPAVFARELRQSPAQARASDYINLFRQPQATEHLLQGECAYLRGMFADEDGRMPAWFDHAERARYLAAWSTPGAVEGGLNYYRATSLHPATDGDPGVESVKLDEAALRVKAPTLMLWGERDRYLLPGCSHGVQQHVPDLRVERFPSASHWIAHEEPQAVNRLIREHLQPVLKDMAKLEREAAAR